jgi:4-hydroxybenzoate polyprenyltransferase
MSLKEKISARINKEINWPFFILTVLAVILVRNLLEMYSNPFYHIDFSPGYFVFLTTPLFFSAILLSLILLIYYFARLEFRQAFNLGILFFPIILTPPLIDLAVTGGRGAGMAFLSNDSWSSVFTSLFTFFGKFVEPGITLGIRVEIVLIIIGIGYLVYSRTRSFRRSIGGAALAYLILFFYMVFPTIFALLFGNVAHFKTSSMPDGRASVLALKNLFANSLVSSVHFLQDLPQDKGLLYIQQFNILTNRAGWLLLLSLSLWLFYLGNKRVFDAWKRNLRWERIFYYLAISILGIYLGWRTWVPSYSFSALDILGLIIFFILVAMSFWLAVGINDLSDIKTDRISNSSRPLVKGTISPKEQNFINLFLFVFILMGAATINYLVLIMLLFFQAVYFIYSAPPLRLKRFLGLSSLLVGLNGLLAAMAGFYFIALIQRISFFPKYILAMILLGFTLAVNIKDIKDYEGDKADGIKTIPVFFGLEWGKRIIAILAALALIIVALLTHFKSIEIASFIFSVIFFFLIIRKDYEEKPIFSAFFCYLAICIIAMIFS